MELLTQPSTQLQWDGRRSGGAFSLPEYDDVICILHPSSESAIRIAKLVWKFTPYHILQHQKPGLTAEGTDEEDDLQMEEVIVETEKAEALPLEGGSQIPPPKDYGSFQELDESKEPPNLDIALRTSSEMKDLNMGFVFGREPTKADVVIRTNTAGDVRVSAMHFRIWVNEYGVLMLQDLSTNGTWVDDVYLTRTNARRMLNHGSMIEVVTNGDRATNTVEKARFIVKLPQRKDDSCYKANLREYLLRIQEAKQAARPDVPTFIKPPEPAGRGNFDLLTAGTARFSWALGWDGNGKYNPIGEIGKGAFAIVFKVATADQGEIFAAKRIDRSAFVKNGIVDTKFYNELNIMKKVDHPHIVTFHDWHLDPHHLFIVMEFVPCGDMAPYIRKENFLGEPVLRSVTKQLLHALNYIHSNGVVHRDIKPENLLVYSKDPWIVKLSDFGLSKMIDKDDKGALITFCGTLLYCAPEVYPDFEQMKNGAPRTRRYRSTPAPYSSAVDIWSLGTVLYYFIASKPPYKGTAEDQGYKMLHSILYDYLDFADISPPKIQPSGLLLLTNMLNVAAQLRPSAKELLGYEWLKNVADVVPVPRLEDTESFADLKLETLEEEDESSRWGDDEFNGFDESESFARAAEGLLPDPDSEVPGLVRDSTSTDDRFAEAIENSMIPQAERVNSLSDDKPSVLSSVSESAGDDSNHTVRPALGYPDLGPGSIIRSSEDRPATVAVFRQRLLHEAQLYVRPDEARSSAISSISQLSDISNPSALEGWVQGNVTRSDAAPTNTGMLGRPVRAPLFGEVTDDAALASESGVFGASQHPVIHRSEKATQASKWSTSSIDLSGAGQSMALEASQRSTSSASLSGAEQTLNGVDNQSFNRQSIVKDNTKLSTLSMQKGKRHRLAEVMSAADFESSSDGEPAAKKSMTCANKSPSETKLVFAEEDDFSHSVSQGINALRLQGAQIGTLTPLSGCFSTLPLILNSRMTIWGRAPDSTHVYPNPTDTRVPKNGMDIYFWTSEKKKPIAQNLDWRNMEEVYAVIMTRSRNGIKVNNVRLKQSPPNGPFKIGKLYTGDIIEIFNDGKSYLKYHCEFNIGESAKERAHGEDFVVEDNPELYAAAVASRSQSPLQTS